MSFDPYIHFQGNCAGAMEFYRSVFGGSLYLMRYSEMPGAEPPMAGSDLVMHSCLTTGTGRMLMAGDFPPGMEGDPQKAVSLSHFAADMAQARAVFDALREGGTVILDFGPTFWSAGYGMVKDRFGTHWMVAIAPPV